MNHRRAILNVFAREPNPKPVVCLRLNQWFADARANGRLPADVAGMTVQEIALHLGFAVAARFRDYMQVAFPSARVETQHDMGDVRKTIAIGGRTLTTVSRHTPEMAAAGMMPHLIEPLLKSDDDYRVLIGAWESAHIAAREREFVDFDRETGETGLPMIIIGPSPVHKVALEYVGYERFYLDHADRPALLDALIDSINAVYRAQLWPMLERSAGRLILHGTHFSQSMTPPPVFEKYFAPYFADFNRRMHAAGKWVAAHCDADLGRLIPRVAELGFDCADCLATAPLVKETLGDCLAAWSSRVVAWGALPSVIFDTSCPAADYESYVDRAIEVAANRTDVILGSGDIVMPGTPWDRLVYLSQRLNG